MTKLFIWKTLIACLAGVLVLAPMVVQGGAQDLAATFFIAHADTHEDASVVPITVAGGRPATFEVRVRDAGSSSKAGWQARIALDACRFEMPSVTDVQLGDYLAPCTPLPIGPAIRLEGNRILVDQGQFCLTGGTDAPGGLLATVTVLPKARVDCPDPTGTPPDQVTAEFDLAVLGAPGGVKYDVTPLGGRFTCLARMSFLPLVFRTMQ